VIEKFGVPPEKVVEVQALAGDSTDNVPGVPGIGIKTAAQLIVEYGDLETLLKLRAGEIKQPKRREALIENAEKARISRQLVLLDDKVKLDVPLDELAVHEPDARKLIAFLKAMEFSTLTRRVAEYSQIDPSDVEADAGNKSGAFRPPRAKVPAKSNDAPAICLPAPPAATGQRPAPTSRTRPRASRARRSRSRRARRAARKAAGRSQQIPDHPQPRSAQGLDRARARGRPRRFEAKADSIDPMQAEICGIALALAPNDACYIPLATSNPAAAPGCSMPAGAGPDQGGRCARALRPLLESAGILKIGFNIKFNAVMFAQHGITSATMTTCS
jgi:DNA polymerase-1